MNVRFSLGLPIYYVPRCDHRLARYVPVTCVHWALSQPLLTLGDQLVIAPKLTQSGRVAQDKGGSFWISKEAFEARPAGRYSALKRRIGLSRPAKLCKQHSGAFLEHISQAAAADSLYACQQANPDTAAA
jgi:hypothetical protein